MNQTDRLVPVETIADIPAPLRDTPVGRLLEYHNLGRGLDVYASAQMLIGMCMDHRKHLRIPDNFAYVIRSGGANLRYSEFTVSYAIAVGGARAIALLGHTNCGMCGLAAKRERFVQGMVAHAGWDEQRAVEQFNSSAPLFETGDEVDFVTEEAARLGRRYPKILVVPMIYKVEDNRIYLVRSNDVGSNVTAVI